MFYRISLGIQSPCQKMIGVYNHLLRKRFRFHYRSQKVIGSRYIMMITAGEHLWGLDNKKKQHMLQRSHCGLPCRINSCFAGATGKEKKQKCHRRLVGIEEWHMGVSENSGTQQLWVFLLKMIILGCFGGTTIEGNTYIFLFGWFWWIIFVWGCFKLAHTCNLRL